MGVLEQGWSTLRTSHGLPEKVQVWEYPWTWDRKLDLFKKQSSSLKQAQLLTASRAATSWVLPDPSLKIKPRGVLTILFKDSESGFFLQILHLYLEKLAFSMCHSSFQGYVYKRTLSIYTHSYTHPQFPSRDSKILAGWGWTIHEHIKHNTELSIFISLSRHRLLFLSFVRFFSYKEKCFMEAMGPWSGAITQLHCNSAL